MLHLFFQIRGFGVAVVLCLALCFVFCFFYYLVLHETVDRNDWLLKKKNKCLKTAPEQENSQWKHMRWDWKKNKGLEANMQTRREFQKEGRSREHRLLEILVALNLGYHGRIRNKS